jgi:hypothetical protein
MGKKSGKNAEKIAVNSAKKRENRVKDVTFSYSDAKVKVKVKYVYR